MKKNKQTDQWIAASLLIIAAIFATFICSSGNPGKKSYIQAQRKDQFCLDLSKEISGTVKCKRGIYQDCKGD